jgi:hypothetical protein
VRVFGVCSGLGPPLLVCRRCGERIDSERGEWVDFGPEHRRAFWGTTWLYVLAFGFLGGVAVWAGYHLGFQGQKALVLDLKDPAFLVGAGAWGALILTVQVGRIVRSRRRTVVEEAIPVRVSFWSLDYNLQFKFCLLWLLVLLLGPFSRLLG